MYLTEIFKLKFNQKAQVEIRSKFFLRILEDFREDPDYRGMFKCIVRH